MILCIRKSSKIDHKKKIFPWKFYFKTYPNDVLKQRSMCTISLTYVTVPNFILHITGSLFCHIKLINWNKILDTPLLYCCHVIVRGSSSFFSGGLHSFVFHSKNTFCGIGGQGKLKVEWGGGALELSEILTSKNKTNKNTFMNMFV